MTQPKSYEPWRSMQPADRDVMLAWLNEQMEKRWEDGRVKYQSDILGFRGEPEYHAPEEAFDLIVYQYYNIRKMKAMAERIRELESEVEFLKKENRG